MYNIFVVDGSARCLLGGIDWSSATLRTFSHLLVVDSSAFLHLFLLVLLDYELLLHCESSRCSRERFRLS